MIIMETSYLAMNIFCYICEAQIANRFNFNSTRASMCCVQCSEYILYADEKIYNKEISETKFVVPHTH